MTTFESRHYKLYGQMSKHSDCIREGLLCQEGVKGGLPP